jgi:gamma-glutamyl hydrolase
MIKTMSLINILVLLGTALTTTDYIPVIGILSNSIPENTNDAQQSSIPVNYIRWLEDAGAKVVPIHPWMNEDELSTLMGKINGVLWTGGGRTLDPNGQYEKVAGYTLSYSMFQKANHNTTFPLWGTCQGFQLLHVLLMNKDDLDTFDSMNIRGTINVNKSIPSRVLSYMTTDELDQLGKVSSVAEFHHFGISQAHYDKYPQLGQVFKRLATANDRQGKEYIAVVEGIDYPIYGVQFHPEKIVYDRAPRDDIPLNYLSIKFSQSIGNWFVNEARSNDHRMSQEELVKYEWINTFEKLPVKVSEGMYEYMFNKNMKNSRLK